jgi:glutaredoxin
MSKYLQSNPRLVKEFNYKKNYPLIPKDFTINSNKKVWWLCRKGHEWESIIYSRVRQNSNCPHCKSLKFLYPEIAKEWHPTKNVNLKPENVTKGSHKKVWWLCHKGHEWQVQVYSRTKRRKSNCPFCWKKNKFLLKEKLTF